jgi:hypothetical protein
MGLLVNTLSELNDPNAPPDSVRLEWVKLFWIFFSAEMTKSAIYIDSKVLDEQPLVNTLILETIQAIY